MMDNTKIYNFVVLDCETGGLDRKEGLHAQKFPITEIGMVAIKSDTFEELGKYQAYIAGQEDEWGGYVGYDKKLIYQEEALKFTGITIEKLRTQGVNYKTVVREMAKIFKQAKTGSHMHKPIIVGHNITYDLPFIQYLFEFAKEDLSKLVSGYKDHKGIFHPHYFDTMWLSRMHFPKEKESHTLENSCSRNDVELFNAHSALDDVVATTKLFCKFLSRLRSNTEIEEGNNISVSKFRETFFFS